jgi:hypothetical protein
VNERDWQRTVLEAATIHGWHGIHVPDSRRIEGPVIAGQNTAVGFPDWVFLHPRRGELAFAELKKLDGKVSREQHAWLTHLGRVREVRSFLWRPSDLAEMAETFARPWLRAVR